MKPVLTDGRLGTQPSPTLVEQVNAVELANELADAEHFVLIDLAHALMLTQEQVFDPGQGRAIVAALLELLENNPREALAGDPAIGTITLQIERYLEERCGPGGLDIQRARSRIDQNATGLRMADRKGALAVMSTLIGLGEALLDAAESHDDVLAPGYTHLQHAQPTTLGHYFNAHYWPLSRNLARLSQVYERLNECPLGGAAHSGTAWPIDRDATAAYLGFDRPVRNARDAGMSSVDVGAELAGALGLTLSGISRCASDLFYWSSSEVGMVRLHPSLCGTSSMMPQKRNPIALERIRGLAGDAAGWGASQLGILHFATSTDSDQAYVHNRIPGYCQATAGAVTLLTEAVATLEVHTGRLGESAGRHWSTSSALADDLVRTQGLSYRGAHEAVARLITAHESAGATDGVVRADLIDQHFRHYSAEELAGVLDARNFVESRTSAGGTSATQRRKLAAQAAEDLRAHRRSVEARIKEVEQARVRLLRDATSLTAGYGI
ncbi:lyase family protein [Streptomyces coeruleofuscus]|uniref:argininosuccinate lyase n=1 Tax=Streptomyces coeruleofuscus TaxID=66879 RepID=A0ABP5UKV0_9ACTN